MSKLKRKDEEFIQKLADAVSRQIEQKLPKRKEWLRTKDVCEMLNVSEGTLQQMRINGDIPFTKVSTNTLFYPYEGLVKALESKTNWGKGGKLWQ